MLVRLFFSGYSTLLARISLAAMAVVLTGCNDKVAEKPAQSRPVLVATAHYEAQSPERSFVGTIRPRIETDMGFRVPGKVAKRLVEVGESVDVGQPLATLDEVDLKLQAEQADADKRVAQAKAEVRRAAAVAVEQEMRAKTQEMRAKVVEAESQIPLAMAEAFRSGNMGIMDYMKVRNVEADTKMRDTIAGTERSQEDVK